MKNKVYDNFPSREITIISQNIGLEKILNNYERYEPKIIDICGFVRIFHQVNIIIKFFHIKIKDIRKRHHMMIKHILLALEKGYDFNNAYNKYFHEKLEYNIKEYFYERKLYDGKNNKMDISIIP